MNFPVSAPLTIAQDYCRRWECNPDGEAFATHASFFLPVKRHGQPLMLKIVHPDTEEMTGVAMLNLYNGHGAVRLFEVDGPVQLLERIRPTGPSLEDMVLRGQDDEATEILCSLIVTLHRQARKANATLPDDMLTPFSRRVEDMRGFVIEGRVKPADRAFFSRASDISENLIHETRPHWMKLHGDIHHFNVLHCADRGWLAIDPKGIWGPEEYEYASVLCNPHTHDRLVGDPKRMDRQAALIAALTGLNKKRLLQFAFTHAMQVAAWCLSAPDQACWLSFAKTALTLSESSPA